MRKPRVLTLILAGVLSSASAFSVEPKAVLKGPATASIGEIIYVQVAEYQGDQFYVTYTGPGTAKPEVLYVHTRGSVPDAARIMNLAGTHRFHGVALGADASGKTTSAVSSWTVIVTSKPAPTPGPGPTPPPNPPGPTPPGPVADVGVVWVSLISDANTKTQAYAQLEADPSLEASVSAVLGILRIYDASNQALDTPTPAHPRSLNLRQYLPQTGLPALIIQGTKTSKVVAMKCPMTVKEVMAEVAKFTGR